MIITPPYLKKGDTIGIVCPAGYMAAEKVKTCIQTLQAWGFNVKVGKTVGGDSPTYFSGTDGERLEDFQQMLDDSAIDAILFGRGGYGMGRIIERVRFKRFRKKPKWLMGYSDITVLHSHIYSNYYISTIHSPMAAAFNEGGHANEFVGSLYKIITGEPMDYFCAGHELNRPGNAEGELVGGNLALLAHLTGTASDIRTKNRILFIEDVGEYLYNIDRMMHQLKRSGKLDRLAGLVVGKFSDSKDTERPFGCGVYDIIEPLVREYDYPVCYDFPVSHTDENVALKIGFPVHLSVAREGARLTEISKKKK